MKKKLIFLLSICLLLTGCAMYRVDNVTYEEITNIVFLENTPNPNTALRGYKLYLPVGMTLMSDANNNNIIYSSNNKYYLYVDLISYYNKTFIDYKISEQDAYFSKDLNYDNKLGYIKITEFNDKYLLEVMYNNAKIEVITNDLNIDLAKSLIILKSITFNDKVIESLLGNNILTYNEEELGLLGPINDSSDILKYDNHEYTDIDNELPDEYKLDIINNE